ncbi:MAG: DNA polymerase I [Acidobacteriota bacterium]|nr:DNA polymerase I [Acidobacteriota bacterium]
MPVKKKPAVEASDVRPAVLPPEGKGRVFLIDAYSFVFRAYHAMARQRPMSTRSGLPTAATFVFVNMLNKLRKDFHPELIAAVFDMGPSFREEQAQAMPALKKRDKETGEIVEVAYAGYKANRAEMPEDLRQQVPYIQRALQAYRIPVLGREGYEADDVIGTLAHKASEAGYGVYVVSSDKDMLQLVNDRVCVLNPPKDNLICDAALVEELMGVRPDQIIDLLALRGDAVDNVPGAPGIGEKGSTELIREFGSLTALLERAAEVQRKSYRESLQQNRETILLSRDLVTIDCNAPIDFDAEAMKSEEPDVAAARELFTELEFNGLLKEVLSTGEAVGETHYAALTAEALAALQKAPLVALALEEALAASAASVEEKAAPAQGSLALGDDAAGKSSQPIALSAKEGEAHTANLLGESSATLAAMLAAEKPAKAVHDLKAALHALAAGPALHGAAHDTMLYSYLLDPTYSSHTLPEVALRRLGLKLSGTLAEAADVTLRLANTLAAEVAADAELQKLYDEIDLPLVPVLQRMEAAGILLDSRVLAAMSASMGKDIARLDAQIHELAGETFNVNSPKKLGEILFDKLALPRPFRAPKNKPVSTAQDVLEPLANDYEIVRLVLEFRQISKLKSTYVDALPQLLRDSRLHTSFNQASTATGRLSSINPNLQNIPIRTELGREIRAAFVAPEGWQLVGADYSQIELRLLAHYSADPMLVEAYRTGQDIHALTAAEVFGVPPMLIDAEHRRRAKAVNFGIVYGLSPFGLAQQLGIEQKEAKRFIEAYFERYQGVRTFIDRTLDQARRDGHVRNLFGRKRPIPDLDSKNPNLRGFAERTAVNTPLQGTAADLIKIAMIRLDRELTSRKLKARMLLQVHDELVLEAPNGEVDEVKALLKECMEGAYQLRVPMEVEVSVGTNWRDME